MQFASKRHMETAPRKSRPAAKSSGWKSLKKVFSGSSLAQVLSDSPSTPSTCTAAAAAACAAPATHTAQQESTTISGQQSGASAVRVAIQVNRRVDWGDRIAVVGEPQALGAWQAGQGLDLVWSQGDVWRAEVGLQPGVHEFKCVTIRTNGQLEWEVGSNRVIEVPAPSSAGVMLEAVCTWADTAATSVAATAAACMEVSSSGTDGDVSDTYRTCSSLSETGSGSNPDGSLRSYRLDLSSVTQSTSSEVASLAGSTCANSNSGGVGEIVEARKLSVSADGGAPVQQQQQQQDDGLVSAESSGDVSMYTAYDAAGPFAAAAGGGGGSSSTAQQLPPLPRSLPPTPQQQQHSKGSNALTAASLKQAAAAEAAAAASGAGGASAGAAGGMRGPPRAFTASVSSSPMSAGLTSTAAALNLLSPAGTDMSGQLPVRAISSSTLSFSSLEVSDAVLDDSCGAGSEEGLPMGLTAAGSAFGGTAASSEAGSRMDEVQDMLAASGSASASTTRADSGPMPGAADAAVLLDEQLFEASSTSCGFEQLMAVEPELLLLQEQQQLLIEQQADAAVQAARANNTSNSSSVFAAAPSAPAGSNGGVQDFMAAAAADLPANTTSSSSNPVPALAHSYLPSEETLPPTALAQYRGLSEIEEVGDDEEGLLEDYPAITPAAQAAAAAGAAGAAAAALDLDDGPQDLDELVPDAEPSRRRSSNSSCSSASSRLSKDQLPMLGLTVNVPSAAATAAAQMNAAKASAAAAAAAAAAAKCRPEGDGGVQEALSATEGLKLCAAAHIIPHVDKVQTGGEDAFFISNAGHGALGVSDGVSAWAEDGIDPGEYSRTLVQHCAESFEEKVVAAANAANQGAFIAKFDPRSILRYAQQCTCKPGSATMVLAAMQPGGQLHVANLGDCGIKVVREGRVVFETKPQQHDFNLPYQLSHPQLFPDTDTADSADRYQWQVQEGDIIVAASDGLYDNLWDDELLQLLHQGLLGIMPTELAASLSRVDSVGSIGSAKGRKMGGLRGKHSRSSSTSQLPALLSSSSSAMPVVAAASAAPASPSPSANSDDVVGGGADANKARMPRSRSTSHLSSWGAKQFRSWKNKASGKLQTTASTSSIPSVAELHEQQELEAAAQRQQAQQQQPTRTLSQVTADDIARAAELVAAAAAAHAADKEFKSPWSVAAGRAYGLLARLFAKGGKMDDITCVIAVVQDAGGASSGNDSSAQAAVEGAAAPGSQASEASGVLPSAVVPSSSDMSPSDDSSIGPLTSEGSGISTAVLDELQ